MLRKIGKTFLARRDGIAAVEFALLSPILLFLFLGGIELTDALNCKQKVTGMSAEAADLIAQEMNVTNADMSNVFSAMNSVIYPYSAIGLQVVISSLADDGRGHGKVVWSDAQNTTARTANSTVNVPAGVITHGGTVILAEVTYPYRSTIAHFLAGITNMKMSFYARPRRTPSIARLP